MVCSFVGQNEVVRECVAWSNEREQASKQANTHAQGHYIRATTPTNDRDYAVLGES